MERPKKCPKCGSSRVVVNGQIFSCKKCLFVNKPMEVKNG